MGAVDDAKKYLSLRPPMENKTIFALHPDVLVAGLLDEIERLREALQFYASKNNYEKKKVWTTTLPQYEPDEYKIVTPVLSDNGERARAALKEDE